MQCKETRDDLLKSIFAILPMINKEQIVKFISDNAKKYGITSKIIVNSHGDFISIAKRIYQLMKYNELCLRYNKIKAIPGIPIPTQSKSAVPSINRFGILLPCDMIGEIIRHTDNIETAIKLITGINKENITSCLDRTIIDHLINLLPRNIAPLVHPLSDNDFENLKLVMKYNKLPKIKISMGSDHSMIVLSNKLLCSGNNSKGQLGLGGGLNRRKFTIVPFAGNERIVSVYCGTDYTLVKDSNSNLLGCGNNDSGQLGLIDKINRVKFTKIPYYGNGVSSVFCGYKHTILIDSEGHLWATGSNDNGQLGIGLNDREKRLFTKCPFDKTVINGVCNFDSTYIVDSTGQLWKTNLSTKGVFQCVSTRLPPISSIVSIENDKYLTVVDMGGKILTRNITGTIGNHRTYFDNSQIIMASTTVGIPSHIMALDIDGKLWGAGGVGSWMGFNDEKKRYGSFENIPFPEHIISFATGERSTLILDSNFNLWGSGDNSDGQLGIQPKNVIGFTLIGNVLEM